MATRIKATPLGSKVASNRFDVAAKKAQRQNPSYPTTYRCLASAFAHLGRDAEAREAGGSHA
jgi:hypothetical protein